MPKGRERDFFTANEVGLKQLIESFDGLTRLFVVSNDTTKLGFSFNHFDLSDSEAKSFVEETIRNFLEELHPTGVELSKTRFLVLPCDVFSRNHSLSSSYKGQKYYVTDEKIQVGDSFEYIRRLRFEVTGNFCHSESSFVLDKDSVSMSSSLDVGFKFDYDRLIDMHYKVCWFGL
ncbi:hypothetical protein QVD17_36260 [Tagetes erecta]|uniref:Uncharacterized protein n=1 Tax=Tagetes erecta TaxID=13708 RepID=A0AAD8JU97_TARER|nr:hypothetical protein QVD17_36260 [Tagetes erecta]